MKDADDFRYPELTDKETGLYVTEAQITFFLNRPNGLSLIENDSQEWLDYKRACELWNLIYDCLGEALKNESGYLTWDDKEECLKVKITSGGPVDIYLTKYGI